MTRSNGSPRRIHSSAVCGEAVSRRQYAPRFDLQQQNAPIRVVVVDDQHALAAQLRWRGLQLSARLEAGCGFSQDRKVESRAGADFALDPQRAAP